MSCVTCYMFFCVFFLSGEVSQGRVCYQRGLPRLVSIQINKGLGYTVRLWIFLSGNHVIKEISFFE